MNIDTSITERVTGLAAQIQQIASATFHEKKRAEFILDTWRDQGVPDAMMDEVGNVYACLHGRSKSGDIVISAHLDTVFPMDTLLTCRYEDDRIYGPGIGDNSLGLAGLFGVYWSLFQPGHRRNKSPLLQGDVWLVANIGEEGLGDLQGMKAVVEHFGASPAAYIILEGMSLGQVYHRGLGVRRYRISVKTRGGHSWIDYGSPSAVHELAELVVKIKDIPLPVEPRTSINIGTITGGTSVNTIAAEASCELDLRSESGLGLASVVDQVLSLVAEAGRKSGHSVNVHADVIGNRPTGELPIHHRLVKMAAECLEKNGIKPRLNIGSTDANVPLSRGLPAICVGLTTGGGAHTLDEYIDIHPLSQGLGALLDIVWGIDKGSLSPKKR